LPGFSILFFGGIVYCHPVLKTSAKDKLIANVANADRFRRVWSRTTSLIVVLSGVCGIGLLASRLGGLLPPDWFRGEILCFIPLLAVAAAFFSIRRVTDAESASLIDSAAGTKDLFLSAMQAGRDASGFAGVLVAQAEERAAKLKTSEIVPQDWWPGFRNFATAISLLAIALEWMPQFDPLKMQQARAVLAQRSKQLAESIRLTQLRKAELREKGSAVSGNVEESMQKIASLLRDIKPHEIQDNARRLNEAAQELSELWKKAKSDLPRQMDNVERTAQRFGDPSEAQEMKKMIDSLKKGDATALKQALEKTRKKIEDLSGLPEGAERQKQMEALAKELGKLANQMREQLGDKAANQAMQRALEQLGMAKDKDSAKEAMDAAADSLNLSQAELEKLAENFKDAADLEGALQNLAKAKQLNAQGKLDGGDAEGAKSMEDYKKLYDELMAKNGMGDGAGEQPGQGKAGDKPGIGRGGNVGEPDVLTKTKDEKSKSKMGAGKLLMQWNEEGQGERGAKAGEYLDAVKDVKEGVAEAIRNERIPPGYHGSIQKYFDQLPEKGK
jgi:hypothetical protein